MEKMDNSIIIVVIMCHPLLSWCVAFIHFEFDTIRSCLTLYHTYNRLRSVVLRQCVRQKALSEA